MSLRETGSCDLARRTWKDTLKECRQRAVAGESARDKEGDDRDRERAAELDRLQEPAWNVPVKHYGHLTNF